MRIGVDIRTLVEAEPSGVGEYTREILEALFKIDHQNEYHLFANSAKAISFPNFDHPNVRTHFFRFPNKLLNASLALFNAPKINYLISTHQKLPASNFKLDLFFMPNINFVAIDDETPVITTVHDISYHL